MNASNFYGGLWACDCCNIIPTWAQVVIFLVLLISWLRLGLEEDPAYEFLEYFAGCARLSKVAAAMGYPTEAYELDYGLDAARRRGKRGPMDLNSSAGLVLLVSAWCVTSICLVLVNVVCIPRASS